MRRAIALFILAVILASGCSSGKPSSVQQAGGNRAPSGAPTAIKLGVLTGWSAPPRLDAVIAAFQDRFPAYRVEIVSLGADPDAVYQAMSKGEVDLVEGGSGHLSKALEEGALADLTPYLATAGVSTAALSWFLDALAGQGKVLELPYAVYPMGIVYNRDLASAAGVTIPEAGWTWDQFRDIAQRLTKQSGSDRTWGFAMDRPAIPVIGWVKQAGGPPANQPSADSLANALRYFSELIFSDRSTALRGDWDGKGQPPADLFLEGKAAMTISYLADMRHGQPLPFQAGIAPIPNLPGARPLLFVQASTLAMSSRTPNPAGAWQFLKFLTGPEAAVLLAASGYLPCYPSAEAKLAWLQSKPGLPQSVASLLDAQWITMWWYLTDRSRDGLIYAATRDAFVQESSWKSAVSAYARRAKLGGIN